MTWNQRLISAAITVATLAVLALASGADWYGGW